MTVTAQGRDLLERMDRLPGWPLPRFDFAVLGIAYFFVFYDISDIGFAMPAVAVQYHLSDNAVKFVAVAIGLIGYIVGSNLIGALSDRRGRRMAFVTSLIISGLGSLGCALATGLISLSVWRFVTGIGVGAALNLASTYVGEMSPASQRGRISVSTFMVGIIGQAITPFVALGLVPNFTIGWRLLFAIGAVIGAVGVVFGLRLPESPRWLIDQGRIKEAEALIGSMESRFDRKDVAAAESGPHGEAARTPAEAPQVDGPAGAEAAGDDRHQGSATRELLRAPHVRTVLAMVTLVVPVVHRQLRVPRRCPEPVLRERTGHRRLDPVPGGRCDRLPGGGRSCWSPRTRSSAST